jgi:hypothetical protein
MAASMWTVGGSVEAISINFECSNWKVKRNIVYSELVTLHGVISNESSLEFKLDIDELQELYNMSTRPHVRSIMSSVVSKLEILDRSIECEVNKTPTMKKKCCDLVAGSEIYETEKELPSIQNIQTVIISHTSPVTNTDRRRNETKPSKIVTAPTSKWDNNDGNQGGSCKVIITGGSHTRGYASELSQNLNEQCTVTSYVKPNADVVVLIDTAKKGVSKLTKNDVLIFWGVLMMLIKMHLGRDLLKL